MGRYRITRRLALGGMGAVFEAEQVATELPVAIKVLYPHVLASENAIEKFTLEGRIAGRLNSDHIVRVFDAGYDNDSLLPFLVMELLHGQDLQKCVESKGALPPETVGEYILQVARGLERAHTYVTREGVRQPIVHRDLKPENLFLTHSEAGHPVVKILDFGMAKVLSETSGISQDIKGTPLFMSFEQASGGSLSPQTDIWSLALTTFYLLTGRNYWKTASQARPELVSLFGEILTQPFAPPSERALELGCRSNLPTAFDYWFLRCLDRDPRMRYSSALLAASELEQALGSRRAARTPLPSPALERTNAGLAHLGATQHSGEGSLAALTRTRQSGSLESAHSDTDVGLIVPDEEALPPLPTKKRRHFAVLSLAFVAAVAVGSALFRTPASGVSESPLATSKPTAPAQHVPEPAFMDPPGPAVVGSAPQALEAASPVPPPLVAPKAKPKTQSPNGHPSPRADQTGRPVSAQLVAPSPKVEEPDGLIAPVTETYPQPHPKTRELDALDPYDKR